MHTTTPMTDDRHPTRPPRRAAVGVWCAELLPRAPYEAAYICTTGTLGFAFESQTGVHAFAGDRRVDFRARRNSLAHVPAGCDVYSRSGTGGEYLTLWRRDALDGGPCRDRQFNNMVDPAAVGAATRLRRLLLSRNPTDPLSFERLASVLTACAARFVEGRHAETRAAAWMTARRLARVDEIIEARLEEKITVSDLAEALGLSTGFFSRAFKAAVGQSPHDYVIDRRVSRARLMLASAPRDLSAVAQACGFASHAHMSSTFRTRLGVTPAELRGGSA